MIVVVGSGPAGVACASALLAQDLPVLMIDVGTELEPGHRAWGEQLRTAPRDRWDEVVLEAIKAPMRGSRGRLPLKTLFGSDFPYRDSHGVTPLEGSGIELHRSLALGGLSNVWGAAMLPNRSEDMGDWPIAADDLLPHYRAVLAQMDFAATEDELAELFPLCSERLHPLPPSAQARSLLDDLRRAAPFLRQRGVHFGSSRLAVSAQGSDDKPACVACGLCMYGCPFGLIYNSAGAVRRLLEHPRFRYRGGCAVERIAERNGMPEIAIRDLGNDERSVLAAERVYLACGPLATTRLLLESLEAFDRPLTLKDSTYFLVPLIRFRAEAGVLEEPLHTLSQIFIEIVDAAISQSTVHLQVYSYNDLMLSEVERMLGPLRHLPWPRNAALGRMMAIQGFLHSDLSPTIRVHLRRAAQPPHPLVLTRGPDNPATLPTVRSVTRKLVGLAGKLRAIPATPLLTLGRPGRGYHVGGTVPMRARPQDLESDRLGRPHGFSKVHIVDSTVLPSIPATTITLSVMANAHRIACAYGET